MKAKRGIFTIKLKQNSLRYKANLPSLDIIYRRVESKPIFMKDGRPSSALFKDSKDVSVDRDVGRKIDDIISHEERLHALYTDGLSDEEIKERGKTLIAIIQLTDVRCDAVEACVIPDPIQGENEYHALLQKSEAETQLSKSQAKVLAKSATIIKSYE